MISIRVNRSTFLTGLTNFPDEKELKQLGIPILHEHVNTYANLMGFHSQQITQTFDFYMVFVMWKFLAALAGIQKRIQHGNTLYAIFLYIVHV